MSLKIDKYGRLTSSKVESHRSGLNSILNRRLTSTLIDFLIKHEVISENYRSEGISLSVVRDADMFIVNGSGPKSIKDFLTEKGSEVIKLFDDSKLGVFRLILEFTI